MRIMFCKSISKSLTARNVTADAY